MDWGLVGLSWLVMSGGFAVGYLCRGLFESERDGEV